MSDPSVTHPTTPEKFSIWRNWISLAGRMLAVASAFAFAFLFAIDLLKHGASNPYIGILCYIVAPGFFFAGLAVALLGAWHQKRLRDKGQPTHLPKLAIDLDRPRDRKIMIWFAAGTMSFLLLTALGSYQSYEISESNEFCGEVCHKVMGPEYSAYHRSTHAKVACLECHVGSGATWFVKAKVNGTRQLYGILTNTYSRPIATPVHNMRPASDTCEECHWVNRYVGSIERVRNHYLSDDANSPYTVRLLVNVGGGAAGEGLTGGIHYHMNLSRKVEYFATDAQRQTIPWIRVTDTGGVVTVYRTKDYRDTPKPEQIRRMDCMDCHNRPAHQYKTADDVVDEAIYLGKVDRSLVAVKKVAVDLMTKPYGTQEEGRRAISTEMIKRYGTGLKATEAIQAIQTGFSENIFPEMRADWSKYPDNAGHLDSAGCFRCHDGKHTEANNHRAMPATDCNSCHVILAQGAGEQLTSVAPAGMAFKHPSSDIDGMGLICSDCHNGKNQDN